MADAFAIQDEITQAIVEALKVRLGGGPAPEPVKRYTVNIAPGIGAVLSEPVVHGDAAHVGIALIPDGTPAFVRWTMPAAQGRPDVGPEQTALEAYDVGVGGAFLSRKAVSYCR